MTEHRWGTRHVRQDDGIHLGGWGARLIYGEVRDGMSGVVWDRQNGWGDLTSQEGDELLAFVERGMIRVREVIHRSSYSDWHGTSDHGLVVYRDGLHLFVASPQGSYGYLYVTAVRERQDAYGRTELPTALELQDYSGPAHIVGSGTAWWTAHVEKLEAAVAEARERANATTDGHRWDARDALTRAEDELAAFLAMWPAQPAHGPSEPARSWWFPRGEDGGRAPVWLHAIWNTQDREIVGDYAPDSPFVGNTLDFDTPGLTWDGRVAEAEVYSHKGGDAIVRLFHHDDGDTLEVYDQRYVDMLGKAIEAARAAKGRNDR